MDRPLVLALLVGLLGSAGLARAGHASPAAPAAATPDARVTGPVGAPLPAFALPNLQGAIVRSDALDPDLVLINLWASWCAPCLAELPLLDALQARWATGGIGTVIAVSLDRSDGPVRGVVQRLGLGLPVLRDPSGAWVAHLDPPALPMSYLVAEGRVVREHTGGLDAASLSALIAGYDR